MSHEAPKQPNVSRYNHESSTKHPGSEELLDITDTRRSAPSSVHTTSVNDSPISAKSVKALDGPFVRLGPAIPETIVQEHSDGHPSTGRSEVQATPTDHQHLAEKNAGVVDGRSPQDDQTTSSEAGLKRAFALCADTALKHSSRWLQPFIRKYLPYLVGIVLLVVSVASALALFFFTVNFTGHFALRLCCSNGLSSITKFGSSIPLVGVRDICATQKVPITASSVLNDDPTGIATILNWKDPSENLNMIHRDMLKMSREARSMVLDTKTWQKNVPTADSLHSLAKVYSSAQGNATDGFRQLVRSHNRFMHSIAGNVRLLSASLERTIARYGHTSYILSEFWYTTLPGLSRFSPSGRVKRDFLVFAEYQLSEVRWLLEYTSDLIHMIDQVDVTREELGTAFGTEYKQYTELCLKPSSWYVVWNSVEVHGANPYCYLWDPEEVRRILQQDSKSTLTAAKELLEMSSKRYEILQNRYDGVRNELSADKQHVEKYHKLDVLSRGTRLR